MYTCISKVQCRVNKSQKHNSVFSCTPSTSAHQGTLRDSQRYISQLSAAHLTLSCARNKCSGHGFPHLTHGDPAIPWFLLVRDLMHRTSRKLQMGGRAVLLHTSLRMACRFFVFLLREDQIMVKKPCSVRCYMHLQFPLISTDVKGAKYLV